MEQIMGTDMRPIGRQRVILRISELVDTQVDKSLILIPTTILPSNWNMDSFAKVTDLLPFGKLYINTILMIVVRVVCAVAFCSMAGYAFASGR